MKNTILMGMALTLGMNSISVAASSRVEDVQAPAAGERLELRRELIEDLSETKAKLLSLSTELTQAQQENNESKVAATLGAIATVASGAMTALVVKNSGPGGGEIFFAGAFTLMSGIALTYGVVNGGLVYVTADQIESLQKKINQANNEITRLEQELSNLN